MIFPAFIAGGWHGGINPALDGSKGTGLSPLAITGPVAVGVVALVLYLLHARNNNRALFSLKLFRTRTFSLGRRGALPDVLAVVCCPL
ncbi:hypothetical protein FA041_15395 [Escherichia coli]|nr:hypothetical protein [Escherichia coli]